MKNGLVQIKYTYDEDGRGDAIVMTRRDGTVRIYPYRPTHILQITRRTMVWNCEVGHMEVKFRP